MYLRTKKLFEKNHATKKLKGEGQCHSARKPLARFDSSEMHNAALSECVRR